VAAAGGERAAVAVGHAPAVAVRARVAAHRGVAVADHAMLLPVPRRCRDRVLRMFKDRVAAKLQIIGHRWVLYPHREVAQPRGPETGPPRATLRIGRIRALGPAEATWPPVRTWATSRVQVLGQALVRVLSPDHDRQPALGPRHAMCKTFLMCRMSVVEMSAVGGHRAASVTWQQPLVARWPVGRRPNS
jgi:hypothetical protein